MQPASQDLRHSFPGQETNEIAFIFARPFFFAFIPIILLFLVAFFFGFGVQYVVANGLLFSIEPLTANLIVLLMGIYELICVVVFVVALFDFYFDIFIVTNRRVVDIHQEQLFSRPIAELSLEDVEDVKSEVTGIFETIFNYGDVSVQTAGAHDYFNAENLRYPREITSIILDLSQQAKQDIEQGTRHATTPVMAVIDNKPITDLNDLRKIGAVLPEEMAQLSEGNAS
jgi:hypothetical protein